MATRRAQSKPGKSKSPKPAKPKTAQPLFDAVYASPSDDAARLVLGDALLELGDPRGELIAEQQRRTAKGNASPSKRERELLKSHAERWLAPLDEVLRQPAYRLGFLSGAALKGGVHDVAALHEAPQWRTVEKLFIGQARADMATDLLSVPSLVSLREVAAVAVPVLQAVAKRRGPLSLTTLTSIPIWGPDEPFGGYELLAAMDADLPKLTSLELAGSGMMSFQFEDVEALLESKLVTRLRHFELRCEDDSVDAVLDVAIERGLAHVVVHGDMKERWVWDAATKTLTVPEGIEVSRPGLTVKRGP